MGRRKLLIVGGCALLLMCVLIYIIISLTIPFENSLSLKLCCKTRICTAKLMEMKREKLSLFSQQLEHFALPLTEALNLCGASNRISPCEVIVKFQPEDFIGCVKKHIESIYLSLKKRADPQALLNFALKYRNFEEGRKAREEVYSRAITTSNISLLSALASSFPQEFGQKAEEKAFEIVMKKGKVHLLEEFLNSFPRSKYRKKVEQELEVQKHSIDYLVEECKKYRAGISYDKKPCLMVKLVTICALAHYLLEKGEGGYLTDSIRFTVETVLTEAEMALGKDFACSMMHKLYTEYNGFSLGFTLGLCDYFNFPEEKPFDPHKVSLKRWRFTARCLKSQIEDFSLEE